MENKAGVGLGLERHEDQVTCCVFRKGKMLLRKEINRVVEQVQEIQ